MPDPISFPNQSAGIYDSEQNLCVAPAPAELAVPKGVTPPLSTSGLPEGAQQLVDQHRDRGCLMQDLNAATVCGRAVTSTVGTVPNLALAAVNAFVGGFACGVAVFDAAACHLNER